MPALARVEARVPAHVHAILKHAADLQGRTVSAFVVDAAREAAERAIERDAVIRLTMEDQKRFVDALLAPPRPLTPAMAEARDMHAKMVKNS